MGKDLVVVIKGVVIVVILPIVLVIILSLGVTGKLPQFKSAAPAQSMPDCQRYGAVFHATLVTMQEELRAEVGEQQRLIARYAGSGLNRAFVHGVFQGMLEVAPSTACVVTFLRNNADALPASLVLQIIDRLLTVQHGMDRPATHKENDDAINPQ